MQENALLRIINIEQYIVYEKISNLPVHIDIICDNADGGTNDGR